MRRQSVFPVSHMSRHSSLWRLMMIFAVACFSAGSMAHAAQSTHLYLKANGEDIQGGGTAPTTPTLTRGSIECLSYSEKATGLATGARQYEAIIFRKRIDKSSPLLLRALVNNENIQGKFMFFRPNPAGDGTTEHFFTVEFAEGRLASIRRVSPDVIDPASATAPPTEEISIVFHNITWTYEPTGVSQNDTVPIEIRSSVDKNTWSGYNGSRKE